jgi:hypothetical protein
MGVVGFLFFLLQWTAQGQQSEQGSELFLSADKKVWYQEQKKVFLTGNAVLRQEGRLLRADYIECDLETHFVQASGHVSFQDDQGLWTSEKMSLLLKSGTGSSEVARLESNRFLILGTHIERLDKEGNFEIRDGTYTTCADCHFSWSIHAKRIRLRKEDYAWFDQAIVRLKGLPLLWLPLLVVPLKSQRQSGFLQPTLTFSSLHGFGFQQPLFLDHGVHADQTLSAGWLTLRGFRASWEGRAKWSETGEGEGRFLFTDDPTRVPWKLFGLRLQERGVLSGVLDVTWVNKDELPFLFPEDVSSRVYPYLEQKLSFWGWSPVWYAHVGFFAARRLLSPREHAQDRLWDAGTVQAQPSLEFGLTDATFGFGSLQLDGKWSQFRHPAPSSFLVQGDRIFLRPQWSWREQWLGLEWAPRVGLEWLSYDFQGKAPQLSRGTFFVEQTLSTVLSKNYSLGQSRLKHSLSPELEHRWMPFVMESPGHPFVTQVEQSLVYDERDVLLQDSYQLGAVYFPPRGQALDIKLGQAFLYYKAPRGETQVSESSFKCQLGQTLNLRSTQLLSRNWFEGVLRSNVWEGRFGLTRLPDLQQTPDPITQVHAQIGLTLDANPKQGLFEFNRSFSLRYTRIPEYKIHNLSLQLKYSLNDYVLPEAFLAYSLESHSFLSLGGRFVFQAPARCWRLIWSGAYQPFTGLSTHFQFEINWFGQSFSMLPQAPA